jgi:hypothetical protein
MSTDLPWPGIRVLDIKQCAWYNGIVLAVSYVVDSTAVSH